MRFGRSHWCRSTPDLEHRSMNFNHNRSTASPDHQSMTPTESTASCSAVRIMTHEEFAARHPCLSPINRHAPLAYRVQLQKIDVAHLNALRPQPKPSDNPPETTSTHSEYAAELMEVDKAPMWRNLRKRKENVAKHLKRGANEKEIENDDSWQAVKHEKLQEGDFDVESSMSFSESHWCLSTPEFEHRSTNFNQNRSTASPEHRSTTPTESTTSCNVVRIMTLEDFAARHPHPPSPVYVNIDRQTAPAIDRQHIARLNALRPQPKPSANPPETTNTHLEDAAEPMEVDKAPMRRTLRKRKKKVAKHLKRGANEKEMERLIAACHCGAEYETEYSVSIKTHTPTSIDSASQKSIDNHLEESIDSSPDDWENDYYNPTMAVHTAIPTKDTLHTEEYDEDFEEERATEYRGICTEEDRLLHHSSWTRNATSIDRTVLTSIDAPHHQTNHKRASTDIAYYPSIDEGVDRAQEGNYSIGSWADDRYQESYAVETTVHELGTDELHEGFTTEELLNHHERSDTDSLFAEACGRGTRFYRPFTRAKLPSIDIKASTSIDIRSQPLSTVREKAKQNNKYLTPDEFGIFRDPEGYARAIDGHALDDHGHARDVDGHIFRVSKDDIKSLLERASMDEHSYLCLPEHARLFTQTKLVPEIYSKDEINEMLYGVCGAQGKNEDDFQIKLDGVYYPLNDNISWLTTCMEEMRDLPKSIDDDPSPLNPMKSQPDSCTRAEIDQMVEEIYKTLGAAEERLDKRCDDIYFPWDITISSLTSQTEAMQREMVEMQRYIARRPEASTSINRHINISTTSHRRTSIDEAPPTNRRRLVPNVKSDMLDTNNHGEEIAYATLVRHQFKLECLGDRLQRIENTTASMKDKWRRGDKAMRDFTGTWFNKSREELETCFPAST
ncbi:hypothetical protein DY000_02053310 [Brassica cretica]|uniref:Uncharacterized protein n=1 Tax=Brassica cretica TaxID=69181 RepID=A0ABQ7AHE9_BRACR|nr:hypothetical protein DY000_02053310 [Brassica cretica]